MVTGYQYKDYEAQLQKIADIKYASAVLQWDQETYMPAKGAERRGQQIASLSEIAHELFIGERTATLLNSLLANDKLTNAERRNITLSWEDYNKLKKLPATFVRKMSEAVNKSFHAWIEARKQNKFQVFAEPLKNIIELKKQEADLLGYVHHPYDALMNDYDKGLTVPFTDKLFEELKPQLLVLYNKIRNAKQVDNSFLKQRFAKDKQWEFGIEILKKMQFDFDAGRQDISEHPFTTNFSSHDVRLTTRINEVDFSNMLWSCIHEGGHGLYEQGLPGNNYGLPLGEYCSLSIHESQSRLWENCIGRSKIFWEANYPLLQNYFPSQLSHVTLDQFFKGINKVEPSLIRTEADEITYHLHVMIRYELEKHLIGGSLSYKEIPAFWNEYYSQYLGVKVPDDREGCLQDVHWSHGSFGYFATYSIGSLYAAQFHDAITDEDPSVAVDLSSTASVNSWLKQHIYQYGRYYTSDELCMNATGAVLDSKAFINYSNKKYAAIYELS